MIQSSQPRILNRDDFLSYAKLHGNRASFAGRAWAALARLRPTENTSYSRPYNRRGIEGYSDANPTNRPIFLKIPEMNYEQELGDLVVDSLDALLVEVDEARRTWGNEAIRDLMGKNISNGTVSFLKGIVEHTKLQD